MKKRYTLIASTVNFKLSGFPAKLIFERKKEFLKKNPRIFYLTLTLNLAILITTCFLVGPLVGFFISLVFIFVSYYILPPAILKEVNNTREIK